MIQRSSHPMKESLGRLVLARFRAGGGGKLVWFVCDGIDHPPATLQKTLCGPKFDARSDELSRMLVRASPPSRRRYGALFRACKIRFQAGTRGIDDLLRRR